MALILDLVGITTFCPSLLFLHLSSFDENLMLFWGRILWQFFFLIWPWLFVSLFFLGKTPLQLQRIYWDARYNQYLCGFYNIHTFNPHPEKWIEGYHVKSTHISIRCDLRLFRVASIWENWLLSTPLRTAGISGLKS